MGNIKLFFKNLRINNLKQGLKDAKMYLGSKLIYPIQITGATVTCASATYNGSKQTCQTITVTLNGETLVSGLDYTITTNAGGTNAGSYTVTVTGTKNFRGTASGTFIINKAPTCATAPTAKTGLVYSGSGQALINAGSSSCGTMQYSSDNTNWGTAIPSGTNATSYTTYWRVVNDANHSGSTGGSVSTTIAPKAITYTAPTKKTGLVYNGSAQALVNAGGVTAGTMYYKVGSGSYSTTIPTGTNAGSYTVSYSGVAATNYSGSCSGSITVSIAQKQIVVTAPTANNRTYDTTSKALLNAGSVEGGSMTYCTTSGGTYTSTIPSQTNAGTYTTWWKAEATNSNYSGTSSGSVSTTISAKSVTPTVTLSQTVYTYSRSACQPTPTVKDGSTTIASSEYTVSYSSNVNAGTGATCTITDKSGGNYTIATTNVKFTINKATPVTSTTPTYVSNWTYNATAHNLLSGGAMKHSASDSTAVAGTFTYDQGTNVGTYTNAKWYFTPTDTSNYNNTNGTVTAGSVTCNCYTATAPTNKNPQYTGSAIAYANSGSTAYGTMVYCDTSGGTFSNSVPTAINAGSYDIWYKVTGNTNVCQTAATKVACTISAKSVTPTITLSQTVYTYNASACQPTPTVKDGSVTIPASEYTVSYSNNINAGTATCTITDKSGGNYSFTSGSTNFTINKVNPCPNVVAPTPKVLTFNNANQVLANAGSTPWGTMQYCLNNSGGTYSTSVPSASAANVTYTVWYKVSGNSNIEDCTPASITCSIAEKRVTTPTIELSPSSYTYSGGACQPSVTVKDGSTVIPSGEYTVSYLNNVNAGSGTVVISDNTAGNYYISGTTTFTINPKPVNPTITLSPSSYVYNSSACTPSVTAKDGSVTIPASEYTVSYSNNTNVGTATVTLTDKSGGNYTVSGSKTFTISCYTATAPTAKSLTYTGSAQALVNAGSTLYGTMVYSTTSGGTFSTTIPTGTNAGSYEVWWKVTGNTNVCNTAATKVACTISAKPVTPTITLNPSSYVWSNTNCEPTPTVKDGSTTIASSEYTVSYSNNKAAGTATCTITDKSGGNYTVSGSKTFTISKYTPTAPTAKSLTYNTSAQALVNAGSTSYGSIVYSTTSGGTYSTTIPTGTNAGSYEVWWKLSGDTTVTSNCNNTAATKISCSIAAKTVSSPTITLSQTAYTYANTAFQPTPTVKDGSTTIASSEYTVSYSNNTNVGTATCTITDKSGGNYTVSGSKTFTINCYSATAPTNKNPNWTGSAQAYANAGSTSYGTMVYCSTSGGTFTTSLPTGTNAGSYEVWWKVTGNTNVCNTAATKVACTIAKVAMTYTAPKSTIYTYANTARDAASGGSANGGSIQYSTSQTGTYSTTIPTNTNVGTYDVWWKAVPDSNHSGGTSAAKLTATINCYNATAPTAKSLTYNTSAQALANAGSTSYGTMVYCSTSGGTFSTTMPTGTNAGSYEVWWKVTGNTNVCNTAATKVACSIGAKSVTPTITLSQTSYTYSNSACQPTVTLKDGSTTIATSEYTVSYSNNTNVGTATATVTDKSGGNYALTTTSTTFTIVCKPCTAPTAKSLTYNGSAQALVNVGSTSYGTMVYSTDNSSFSTAIPSGTNATSYTVYWKVTGNTNVCCTASSSVAVTIAKANQSAPTASVTTATYPGTSTASASGGGGQGTLTWTNGSSRSAIGTQDTYAYWAGNSNYNASPNSNAVTLSVAKYTPTVTLSATDRAYDGNALYATASVATPSGGKAMNGTIYYGTTSGAQTYSITYTGGSVNLSSVSVTNVGSATVYAYFVPDSTCNDVYNNSSNASKTFSVTKAEGSVTTAPTGVNIQFDNVNHDLLATAGSGTGTMLYSLDDSTYSTTIPQDKLISAYTVYYKASASTNYNESATGSVVSEIWLEHYVDMGLPSGKMWSSYNVGATAPTSVGQYYSWGCVSGHTVGDGYNFNTTNFKKTPGYNLPPDSILTANTTYDAARTVWGGAWRIPTLDDWTELRTNSTRQTGATEGGVRVEKFTSKNNGNVLIIPRSGYISGTTLTDGITTSSAKAYDWLANSHGSATGTSAQAYCIQSGSQEGEQLRKLGMNIRGVVG